MYRRTLILIYILCIASCVSSHSARRDRAQNQSKIPVQKFSYIEFEVIEYINQARNSPALFAEKHIKHIKGQAAAECYKEMRSLAPLPVVHYNDCLYKSAKLYAEYCARNNIIGLEKHTLLCVRDRIEEFGKTRKCVGENCHYGRYDALEIVVGLLIDATDSNRAHRKTMLSDCYRYIGVCVCSHPKYKVQTVIDFADDVIAN